MTPSQAAELQEKWKQYQQSYRCPHAAVDMERTEDGQYTGNYRCRACGAAVDPPPKSYRLPST
jgi:rubredoxin